jgi:dTDP-4-amino-4,6-dideoxygalactose transaminase
MMKNLIIMKEAYKTNWMSTVGENINRVEKLVAEHVGVKYAVALLSGTDSLHLAIKLVPMEALRFYEKLGFNESRRFK